MPSLITTGSKIYALVVVCGVAVVSNEVVWVHQVVNFRHGGALQSGGSKLLSGLLAGRSNFKIGEIALKFGVASGSRAGMVALQYNLFYDNKDGEEVMLTAATWLLDPKSTEVFAIDGEGNKSGVIGKRASLPNEDNVLGVLGAPITIETADTKLKIEGHYDEGARYLTVSAEKTLADGQVIEWQDTLVE